MANIPSELIVIAHKMMVAQISSSQNIETGILKVKNADGSWNVQLKGRTDYLYGLNYHGSFNLAIGDCVTIGFYEGDKQRPFIMGYSSYKAGSTITSYTYNKDL